MRLNRRAFTAASIAAGAATTCGHSWAASTQLAVARLKVQNVEKPLGLQEPRPRFSWQLVSAARNVRQATYRIRVASSEAKLKGGGADLWDSGVVASPTSLNVRYDGTPLTSRERYFWAIEIVDTAGRTAQSEVTWWEMGLLTPQDWKAGWLVAEDAAGKAFRMTHVPGPSNAYPAQPGILLRGRFIANKPVAAARLYATALGAYEAHLNGKPVGDRKLTPELTDFRKRVLYQTYDVTDLINPGENVLGAIVGEGWYGSPYTFKPTPFMFGPPPCRFLAQLELRYADGSKELVCSDGNWRSAPSAILSSQIYDGEVYDARKEQPGWDKIGFDDTGWAPVEIGEAPRAALIAQVSPPIRKIDTRAPIASWKTSAGTQVFDFGQNFSGWAQLKVKGPSGTQVTLRFAEILKPNGEIDQSNLRTAKAADTYILRGDPRGECYEPYFTYHGFRYVELSGFPGAAAVDAVTGIVVHSDLATTGRFRVGNPVVQKFWENAKWSERSNFVGIPTDCPQRDERMGWLGDAQIFWDAASFNMDTDAFAHRFLDDIRDGQRADGAFPEVTPQAIPDIAPLFGSPGWADAGVILPWTVFRHYGDTSIIDQNWDAMARWIGFVLGANPDLIWRNKRGTDYGDWLAVDAKTPGEATTPKDLIGTAFWAHSTALMANMAKATNRAKELSYYQELAARITTAFQKAFVSSDGQVGNGSQTGYVLPLAFGLLPEALRSTAAERLAANIRGRGTKLSTGFLGTPYILDALATAGHESLAIELLLQTGYPSWGYMVVKRATTMWERWNGDTGDVAMNSYNHYAFGAIVAFMYRRLAGIDMGIPGIEKIAIRPICDPRLKYASGSYESVYGRISSDWRRSNGRLELNVTIPPNAEAVIHVPATLAQKVREDNRDLRSGDSHVQRTESHTLISVGSGTYHFVVS